MVRYGFRTWNWLCFKFFFEIAKSQENLQHFKFGKFKTSELNSGKYCVKLAALHFISVLLKQGLKHKNEALNIT